MSEKSASAAKKRRARGFQESSRTFDEAASPRQQLLRAARKLFAHKGLRATTIRDIAAEADLNSSLISYYFDSKEGLYRECLREIGEGQLGAAGQMLTPPSDMAEFKLRLKMFCEQVIAILTDDRETGLIVVREYDRINSPAGEVFQTSFHRIFDRVVEFFKASQQQGLIRPERDPFITASLFFGAITSQMRLDHIKEKTYKRTIKNRAERESTAEHLVALFTC